MITPRQAVEGAIWLHGVVGHLPGGSHIYFCWEPDNQGWFLKRTIGESDVAWFDASVLAQDSQSVINLYNSSLNIRPPEVGYTLSFPEKLVDNWREWFDSALWLVQIAPGVTYVAFNYTQGEIAWRIYARDSYTMRRPILARDTEEVQGQVENCLRVSHPVIVETYAFPRDFLLGIAAPVDDTPEELEYEPTTIPAPPPFRDPYYYGPPLRTLEETRALHLQIVKHMLDPRIIY